jgi:ribosomal protein L35AE/L33A
MSEHPSLGFPPSNATSKKAYLNSYPQRSNEKNENQRHNIYRLHTVKDKLAALLLIVQWQRHHHGPIAGYVNGDERVSDGTVLRIHGTHKA